MKSNKENKQSSVVVLEVEKYGIILLDSRNWVVANKKKAQPSQVEDYTDVFEGNSYTFHMNIRQAVIELSDRMLKDTLRKSCENKPLELKELIQTIKERDQWMRKAIMGRADIQAKVI